VLPAAHAGAARNAAARLHVPRGRAVGGLQHGLLDRLLRDGARDAGVRMERDSHRAPRQAGGQRPVGREHARVVHDIPAASVEFRAAALRDEREAASRPAPPARGDARVLMGFWARIVAVAAVAGTGLAVISGAAGWGTAHRLLAAVALPPL